MAGNSLNTSNAGVLPSRSPLTFSKQTSLPPTYGGGAHGAPQASSVTAQYSLSGYNKEENNQQKQPQTNTPQKSLASSPGPHLKGGKLAPMNNGSGSLTRQTQNQHQTQNQSSVVANIVAKNLPIKSQVDSNQASRNHHNTALGYIPSGGSTGPLGAAGLT